MPSIDTWALSLSLSATQFVVSGCGWRKGEGQKADENVEEEEGQSSYRIG